jgi:exosortase/archaeosortase family protein
MNLLNNKKMLFKSSGNESPVRFVLVFLTLFTVFYYFNILFFSLTTPGNHYNTFLAEHLNYIHALRYALLHISAQIINWLGFTAITSEYELLVAGHSILQVVYSCLGLGIMSFFAAFVLAYPKRLRPKLIFLAAGILSIQILNILRFVLLALFWSNKKSHLLDHHTIFNIIIYIVIAISLYFWVKHDEKASIEDHATN